MSMSLDALRKTSEIQKQMRATGEVKLVEAVEEKVTQLPDRSIDLSRLQELPQLLEAGYNVVSICYHEGGRSRAAAS